jgi:hypothetical protein
MPSSGILRRVALVRTDVSEEYIASIIKVTRIGELGKLAVTINGSTPRRNINVLRLLVTANIDPSSQTVTMMMVAIRSSKASVLTTATWRNNRVDATLHSHRPKRKPQILHGTLVEVVEVIPFYNKRLFREQKFVCRRQGILVQTRPCPRSILIYPCFLAVTCT